MRIVKNNALKLKYVATLLLLLTYTQFVTAQNNSGISVSLTLSERIVNAEVLNLGDLAIEVLNGGSSEPLFWFSVSNNSSTQQNNLQVEIEVVSTSKGRLVYAISDAPGVGLRSGATVAVNSNQVNDPITGFVGTLSLSMDIDEILSDDGRDIYNAGGTLPDDVYNINVRVLQNGTEVASAVQLLGVKPQQNVIDFFLLQPGNAVGSNATIVSTNPNFRWDGARNAQFRLIVVEKEPDRDESPEGLIQTALSSDPTIVNGIGQASTLLDFEIVDAVVNGNDFTLPPQGVQKLRQGSLYYWQIYYISETSDGNQLIPSTIWEFRVSKPGETEASREINKEFFAKLATIIGSDIAEDLQNTGFQLVSIDYKGSQVMGPQMIQVVDEIIRKFQSGEYKF